MSRAIVARWIQMLVATTCIVCSALSARTAGAHAFQPAFLELRETATGRVDVLWKTAPSPDERSDAAVLLPSWCDPVSPRRVDATSKGSTERWSVDCGDRGLARASVRVDGLGAIEALVRVELRDGRVVSGRLTGADSALAITTEGAARRRLFGHLALGVHHILTGTDHLLFVLGLVLLVRRARALVYTITSFTLAHSVTLSLAALGVVRFPTPPIEAAIAASVLLLAIEAANTRTSLVRRFPWAVAFAFGLLHGFGFAGALAETGLPDREIGPALVGFNVGVEIGQLAFVGALLVLRSAWRKWGTRLPQRAALAPSYAMGSLSVFWLLERVAAFWS